MFKKPRRRLLCCWSWTGPWFFWCVYFWYIHCKTVLFIDVHSIKVFAPILSSSSLPMLYRRTRTPVVIGHTLTGHKMHMVGTNVWIYILVILYISLSRSKCYCLCTLTLMYYVQPQDTTTRLPETFIRNIEGIRNCLDGRVCLVPSLSIS
jgi:hypothetical protein